MYHKTYRNVLSFFYFPSDKELKKESTIGNILWYMLTYSNLSKDVKMRAIFSNPAGWKFIDSNGWYKIKLWRKKKCSAKIASGQALFPPLVKTKNQHKNF